MYQWHQTRGALTRDGILVSYGYSGRGAGLNNPAMQMTRQIGPVPQGNYTIDPACSVQGLGPCVMHLIPHPANLMHGRSGFYIHGDNAAQNHTASEGCIVLPRAIRNQIVRDGDYALVVIA